MNSLKTFEEYKKQGIIKKVSINKQRAESLRKEAERKMLSLDIRLKKIGIDKDNANDYVEYCYDMMMLLIRAKLYLLGYSSSGKGAHEAEVSYTRMIGFKEKDVRFLDQIRYFRNGILYYGKTFDAEYAEKVVEFTKIIYARLKEK